MPLVAVVTFVMYQKVHLLHDDTTVVAAEGDERCLQGPQMHRTLFRFSEQVCVTVIPPRKFMQITA